MNIRALTSTIALAGGLVIASGLPSAAAVYIPPQGTPLYFQFNNLEQLSVGNNIVQPGSGCDPSTTTCEGNWGVVNLSSIQQGTVTTPHQDIGGGAILWADSVFPPGSLGQISGIFYGVTVTSATVVGTDLKVLSTGGFIDIYWDEAVGGTVVNPADAITNSPSDRTAANAYTNWTDGTFLARLAFASGIISGDASTTISGTFSGGDITGSGKADSFANVVDVNGDGKIDGADGAWAALLNGDWFFVDVDGDGIFGEAGETRDLRFSNFTNGLASWNDPGFPDTNDIVGLRSNDPGRVFTVPEPTTLGALSFGLLALGFALRRRRKAIG